MATIPANTIGLTDFRTWDGAIDNGAPLVQQMGDRNVPHNVYQLPRIVGMGGSAYLVCYTSPRSGLPVTVLVVPHRADVDQFGEDYYYFEGMDTTVALTDDFEVRWAELYDQVRDLIP